MNDLSKFIFFKATDSLNRRNKDFFMWLVVTLACTVCFGLWSMTKKAPHAFVPHGGSALAINLCMVKQLVNSHHFIVPDVGKVAYFAFLQLSSK